MSVSSIRKITIGITFSALTILSSCTSLGVEPWQREVLSRPDMQFGIGGMTDTFSQHFYFSKEASSGGQGFAGGGCGCN